MTTTYLFHQAGSIPGIPGTFGNCRVDVADDGTLTMTPLALAGEPIVAESAPAENVTSAQEPPVQPAVQEPIQPEPVGVAPQTPYPSTNGG